MNFNWFDFSIIAVVGLSILISFFRGFLREAVSLVTWVAGLIFAMHFAPKAANWLNGVIATEMLRYVITFILLFMAVFLVGLLINFAIKRGVDVSGLRFADRLLGAAFGAARGILLVAIVLMFMTMTAFKDMDGMVNSELSTSLMPLVAWLDGFLPEQLQQVTQWLAIDNSPIIGPVRNNWHHQNHSIESTTQSESPTKTPARQL